MDATDDPTHGRQALSGYHGYYRQHQYLPLHVYEGHSGFPLAVWLRPGTVHASLGAVDILRPLVARLRAAWPGVRILVRADNGLGVPAVYDFCESEGLDYVIGYASNRRAGAGHGGRVGGRGVVLPLLWLPRPARAALRGDPRLPGGQLAAPATGRRQGRDQPAGQPAAFRGDQPDGRTPAVIYRELYVQRGAVPEQPIGEMKNGLRCDRLSSCGFCANAFRLLVHALAYAIVVLFREAAADVPEVATASVGTLRQRLWKVGAVVVTRARRVSVHVSSTWPYQEVWQRVQAAVARSVRRWCGVAPGPQALGG